MKARLSVAAGLTGRETRVNQSPKITKGRRRAGKKRNRLVLDFREERPAVGFFSRVIQIDATTFTGDLVEAGKL